MLTALQLIKDQLKSARVLFEGTVADIKDEHLNKDPGGKAFSIGATYAHLIFSEDAIVQGMIQGKAPLFETTFKDKTGASSPMPAMDENWEAANEKWSREAKFDMPKLREYEKAVFASTEEYLNTLTDEDLEKEIDLGSWGKKTVAAMVTDFVIGHLHNLAGEISALKGVHGVKGYAV